MDQISSQSWFLCDPTLIICHTEKFSSFIWVHVKILEENEMQGLRQSLRLSEWAALFRKVEDKSTSL